jgi:hypothetical protein
MPQPFPKNDFYYSHKGIPPSQYPLHIGDVRYNFMPNHWPRRHFVSDMLMKQHNFNDYDEIMHDVQWHDYDLDYQLADPMESNHYLKGRSPLVAMMGILFFFVLVVSKNINIKYFSFSFMGLWYFRCCGGHIQMEKNFPSFFCSIHVLIYE